MAREHLTEYKMDWRNDAWLVLCLAVFTADAQEPDASERGSNLSIQMPLDEPLKAPEDTSDEPIQFAGHSWSKLRLSQSVCAIEVLNTGDLMAMSCSGLVYTMQRALGAKS